MTLTTAILADQLANSRPLLLNTRGLTLIEMMMSLLLLLLMAGIVYPLLKTSMGLLDGHRLREELLENNRFALRQLVRESRYLQTVYQSGSGLYEVSSLYLLDSDPDEDRVKYRLDSGSLLKSIDTGLGYGSEFAIADHVQAFSATYDSATKTVSFSLTTQWNGQNFVGSGLATIRGP